MSKPILGLLLGIVLGFIDGLTSWFTPEVRAELLSTAIASSFKGMVVGLAAGFFARKVHSVLWGMVFAGALATLFAYLVAAMQSNYYLEIILPGFIEGLLVGFLTQRYGKPSE
jgi:small basic protein